jgi:uncharacterized membrane protein YbhN (UPF0104 family)
MLRLLGSLFLLAALLWLVDIDATLLRLRQMDKVWIAVAIGCFSIQTVLMAWRWQITAQRLGAGFGLGIAVREYYLSQLVNLCLPGGVLGDASRALRMSWRDAGDDALLCAAHAVVIERIAGQVAVFILALIGVGLAELRGSIDWPNWMRPAMVYAIPACLVGAVAFGLLWRRSAALRRFGHSVRIAVLSPAILIRQIWLSAVIALLMVAAFAACARATGTILPLAVALGLVPIILTAMILPLSVGGWGLREGAAAALFPLFGATAASGVAAGVAYGLALMIACLPGLLVIPFDRRAAAEAIRR